MVLVCIFFLAVCTVGCDDEDSSASKLEEAKIALDEGDYERAEDLLEGMTGAEALGVLASAYAGQVGIDTFEILGQLDDGDTSGNDGSIDLIGKILGTSGDGRLSCLGVQTKSSLMDLAKTKLIASAGGSVSALDKDGHVQLGIYGFTDFILVTGEIICYKFGGGDAQFEVTLTEAGIKALADDFEAIDVTEDQLKRINEDIDYVMLGLSALGTANDLAEEFTMFLQDINSDNDEAMYINKDEYISFLNGLRS